ncbi:MAG: hypothetical protein Kow00129_06490 [Thermoleophilia bacterium]
MADPAVRVSVPADLAEPAGAFLYDLLGPFQELSEEGVSILVFYPFRHGAGYVEDEQILAALPTWIADVAGIERVLVPGGWEESWRRHFSPVTLGRVRVRPPWEEALGEDFEGLVEVVLNPGLAFGTGLHPTTRGMLRLIQNVPATGPAVDVGTGSGILAIAASRLGFSPVLALDNDPQAVQAARGNAALNDADISVVHLESAELPPERFRSALVMANITLEPVADLLRRLPVGAKDRSGTELSVRRVLVAGILSGGQEDAVGRIAAERGLRVVARIYEREWVALDLIPEGRR